jgi:hypothetical protein
MSAWSRAISAIVGEVAAGGALGRELARAVAGGLGRAATDEAGGGDAGVPVAHPAVSSTNARGTVNRRVQAFMALVRGRALDG